MSQTPVLVAAGIVRKDGMILIDQRLPTSKIEPLKWEFPGGKVEWKEHPQDALKREIKEELGIDVRVDTLFTALSHVYGEYHVVVLLFECTYVKGKLSLNYCHDAKWVLPEDLELYEFVSADKEILSEIA